MLPRADLNTNRPPAALEASTPTVSSTDARLEVFRRLSQIAIGREVQATVQSALDDGTYLVKLADSAARMALPVGTRVGDNLSMVLLAKEPRLTFLLTQQQGSAPALLSATARFISQLVQNSNVDGASPALVTKTPLLPFSSAPDPQRIALALRNAIAASGLFYEAHLHEWVNGSRPAGDLAHEPQTQFANAKATASQQDAGTLPDRDLALLAGNMRELGDGVQKLLKLMRNGQLQAADPLLTDADVIAQAQDTMPDMDPEAARLINLQLGILENQQVRWQGELWPGQKMEWEIAENKSDDGSGQVPEQATWTSSVRFELPHLGKVAATVRLSGEHVQVNVSTVDDASAASLREHSSKLADALGAAGATLDALLVKQNEAD